MTLRSKVRALVWSAVAAAAFVACKQGVGDVCQIDDDCESGLECNAGTMRCQKPGTQNYVDAMPRPDAGPPDAGTPDAAL
jgi:hypothetical protein